MGIFSTLLSVRRNWEWKNFSEVLSGDGPRALFVPLNSWQGRKGDFPWYSYPHLLSASEKSLKAMWKQAEEKKNCFRLSQMWKVRSEQGKRDQEQDSHTLGDEGVFIRVLFEKEHASGNHPLSLLVFNSYLHLHVSGVQGEIETEIPELLGSSPRDAFLQDQAKWGRLLSISWYLWDQRKFVKVIFIKRLICHFYT